MIHLRHCENCGTTFDPEERAGIHANDGNLNTMRYCSLACKRQTQNRRHYHAHRARIILRVLENQRKSRKQAGGVQSHS